MKLVAKFLGMVVVLVVAAIAALWFWPASTPAIDTPGAISSLEAVELGGARQWITVRGHDGEAPVLLYLHDGPGFAAIPYARVFTGELEKHFVVVQWDRRGAGKSCAARDGEGPATLGRLYEDLLELSEQLRLRFDQPKIFLVGQSGGGVLGALAAARRPDLFHAYAGISQVVNVLRGEQLSHAFALEAAAAAGDRGAVAELERVAPPYADVDAFFAQREWLGHFGGEYAGNVGPEAYLVPALLAPEYTLREKIEYLPCLRRSIEDQWDEIWQVDLFAAAPRYEIPIVFISGVADRVTPPALVEEYFARIKAPSKELIVFENSAHHPQFEEPERLQAILIERFGSVAAEATAAGSAR